jgi:pyruvate formate lyase activating enzyme
MNKISLLVRVFTVCYFFTVFPNLSFSADISEPAARKPARYYIKADENSLMCTLCPRRCVIPSGGRGFCKVRQNTDGTLYSLVYAKPCAVHIDPVEKKPLFHVLPGTNAFSIATAGCNLACKFCQNWQISQSAPEDVRYIEMPPDEVVRAAKNSGSYSIAYTYSEPTVFYEYMIETARLAKEAGILNIMHSSGFINEEPLRELCGYLDAANIDLKGSDKFYTDFCMGTRQDVLNALKVLKQEGVWIEITYLLIPTLNDSAEYIKETALWIKENLGVDTPLHISRFWPMYKLRNLPSTPVETLFNAHDIAVSSGLNYVYIGNVPGAKFESTYCPYCGKVLIKRTGYHIDECNIRNSRCIFCDNKIPGIWE